MPSGSRSARGPRTVVPVALSTETEGRVQDVAQALGLKREQTLLLSLRRGITVLERGGRGSSPRRPLPPSKV